MRAATASRFHGSPGRRAERSSVPDVPCGNRAAGTEAGPGNFTPIPKDIRRDPTISGVKFMLAKNAETVHEFGSDPRGYFDPGATLTYRTNSLGFRGPEIDVPKPGAATATMTVREDMLNGFDVIRFDGQDDGLGSSSLNVFSSGQRDRTVFV